MQYVLRPALEPYDAEITEILRSYPQRDGQLIGLFRVFANSIRFLRKGTVNLLDRQSPVSTRVRELVILRVTANNNSEYEWGVHVGAFAKHVGLTGEQVRATRLETHTAACWCDEESLLIEVVDQLCAQGALSAPTLDRFRETWTLVQQLEILALCGNYHTISFVANTAELEPEAFAASFPPENEMKSDAPSDKSADDHETAFVTKEISS